MNVHVTVVLSGEDVTRRRAVEVEDALAKAVSALVNEVPQVTYPAHRNGSMGFVLTVGQEPAKPKRASRDKPQPDPDVPIANPDIPEPVAKEA